jgi:DNA polymerase-3 subunit delta
MLIKGDQLAGQLDRGLQAIYVLHGDEPLLTLEAADLIRQKALATGFDEREVLTVLPGFDWGQLTNAGCSMSLFGGRKVIDLRIPNGKPGREGSLALQGYCNHLSPDNLLLITLPELDWKEEKAAWLTALGQAGCIVKLAAPLLGELPGWIAGRLRRQHQKAERDALIFMAERVEGNLLAAHQEIQKLGLLYPAGELSFDQIRDAVLNVARYNIDDLRESLLAGELARYARTLDGLRQEGEALPLILWGLAEEVRALTQLREGLDQGKSLDGLLKIAKVWGPRQNAIRSAVQRLRLLPLQEAMRQLMVADQVAKGLRGNGVYSSNPWELLLRMGFDLCRPQTAKRS